MRAKISPLKMPPRLYQQFAKLIRKNSGLNFADHSQALLIKGIDQRVSALALKDYKHYYDRLCLSPSEYRQLATLLTTGETYFFRYPQQFDFLSQHAIPELLRGQSSSQKSINIWCAGCSTGEEPYSLAMLLEDRWPGCSDLFNIIATDLNPNSLEAAQKGIYNTYSFRTKDVSFRERYFHPQKEHFILDKKIKDKIQYQELNLLHLNSNTFNQQKFHIIFCRNVLIYFNPETILRIKEMLYRLLEVGGYLLLGHSETWQEKRISHHIEACGYSIYQKMENAGQVGLFHQEPLALMTLPSISKTFPGTFSIKKEPQKIESPQKPVAPEETITSEQFYQKGVEAYLHKNLNLAERLFLAELQEVNGNPNAILSLAFLYADQGKIENAKIYCEQFITLDPLQADAYYLQGLVARIEQKVKVSEEYFRRCIYCDNAHILAHFHLAALLDDQGLEKKALKAYTYVIELIERFPLLQELPWKTEMTYQEIQRACLDKIKSMNKQHKN